MPELSGYELWTNEEIFDVTNRTIIQAKSLIFAAEEILN